MIDDLSRDSPFVQPLFFSNTSFLGVWGVFWKDSSRKKGTLVASQLYLTVRHRVQGFWMQAKKPEEQALALPAKETEEQALLAEARWNL